MAAASIDMIRTTQQVKAGLAGLRLDQAAVELFPDYSRARLQGWIRDGSLTIDGVQAKPKQKLAGGEILTLKAVLQHNEEVVPQAIHLQVIAADDHIIVINKPAGLVVHPAAGHPDGTLQNGLLHFDGNLAAIPRSGIVHRLDKDTSGVMVVARSLKAHASLVGQLQDRSMGRIYETVINGKPGNGKPGNGKPRNGQPGASGTVDAPIGRNPRDRQRMAVVPSGRPAISHYRILHAFRHYSHLRVSLESGRTHQIRVHMQYLGHPVVGDPQYGAKSAKLSEMSANVYAAVTGFPRQALHARTLRLKHPGSLERCEFEAPLPSDLCALLDILKLEDC